MEAADNYKVLLIEDLKTSYPKNGVDIEKMDEGKQRTYEVLYNTYRALFTEYMIEKMGLDEFDKKIQDSGLEFKPNDESQMDMYQYFSSNELKYLYIRNNIYIEHLDKDTLSYIAKKAENADLNLDDETKEVIEKTYKSAIFEDIGQDGKVYQTIYGPDSNTYLAPNNGLIIGLNYDEFNQDGITDEQWEERNNKQFEFISDLKFDMEMRMHERVDIPSELIKYNYLSINNIKPREKTQIDEDMDM